MAQVAKLPEPFHDRRSRPKTPALLSWTIIAAVLMIYAHLLLLGQPEALSDIVLGRILGTLDTSFGIVLAYWLGTSRSSHDKDETIKAMGKKP